VIVDNSYHDTQPTCKQKFTQRSHVLDVDRSTGWIFSEERSG